MEYLLILILTIIGICLNSRLSGRAKNLYLFLLLLVIVFIFGFRYKVGGDTVMYMKIFNKATPLSNFSSINFSKERIEPAFQFLCSLFRTFTKEFWPIQLLFAFLTNGLIFIFIRKYCKNPFIGILLYLFMQCLYFTTEILRESVAVGIFLLNYNNIVKKKYLRYYLFCVLSILFHYSAIFTLIIPFAMRLRLNVWYIVLCGICFLITPLVTEFSNLISIASITSRVDTYVSDSQIVNLNLRLGVLLRSGVPTLCVILIQKKFNIRSGFQPMFLLQLLLCCATFAIPDIFLRLINYTSLFTTVAIANLVSFDRIKCYLRYGVLAVGILTQSHFIYINTQRWFPYVSIFQPHEYSKRDKLARYNYHQGWK